MHGALGNNPGIRQTKGCIFNALPIMFLREDETLAAYILKVEKMLEALPVIPVYDDNIPYERLQFSMQMCARQRVRFLQVLGYIILPLDSTTHKNP